MVRLGADINNYYCLFQLRGEIVAEYWAFIRSFIHSMKTYDTATRRFRHGLLHTSYNISKRARQLQWSKKTTHNTEWYPTDHRRTGGPSKPSERESRRSAGDGVIKWMLHTSRSNTNSLELH